MMKIMIRLKEITLQNIWAYISGMYRYHANRLWPSLIRQHIREQFEYRQKTARLDCIDNNECLECGCKIPHLFWAKKSCGGNCYPPMMDADKWERFKRKDCCICVNRKTDNCPNSRLCFITREIPYFKI